MAYDLSEKPNIKKRNLDNTKLSFAVNLEKPKLGIVGFLNTEYDNDKNTVTVERPSIELRGTECLEALDRILPDDDSIIWTNPRKTLNKLLVTVLKENVE